MLGGDPLGILLYGRLRGIRKGLVERLAVIARLKPGAEVAAAELIAAGLLFDPEQSGFQRQHTIYLAADNVVFVFEGHKVEALIDKLIDDPFHWMLRQAIEQWTPLLDESPQIAREKFFWESPQA